MIETIDVYDNTFKPVQYGTCRRCGNVTTLNSDNYRCDNCNAISQELAKDVPKLPLNKEKV